MIILNGKYGKNLWNYPKDHKKACTGYIFLDKTIAEIVLHFVQKLKNSLLRLYTFFL